MMINKKGFGKFEVLTMIVILLCIFAYLMYIFLGGANKQKFTTMKENAARIGNIAATNGSSFRNTDIVYLEEIMDEELLKKNIKSPFSSGYCDSSESKVEMIDGKTYVTLKCDQYLIDKSVSTSLDDATIYEVGEWSSTKDSEDDEEKKLYNCVKDGKEMFSDYLEELSMVVKINKEFSTDYYFASEIKDTCEVVEKTFYRKKEAIEIK